MTREEILSVAKPILFNTDMVRAILDGRKSETRRMIKNPPADSMPDNYNYCRMPLFTAKGIRTLHYMDVLEQHPFQRLRYFESFAPYEKDSYLYVRETWSTQQSNTCKGNTLGRCPYDSCETALGLCFDEEYIYKATDRLNSCVRKWHPSIHMPKEAARIFLRVTDVRVERLQDITEIGAHEEGADGKPCDCEGPFFCSRCCDTGWITPPRTEFSRIWDRTVSKHPYYWADNPWVWVIQFERMELMK